MAIEKERRKHFKYIILGGGTAAGYAAKEFAQQGLLHGELAIISKETVSPYERPIPSKEYLFSEASLNIHVCPPEWYVEKGIELILNTTIVKVNLAAKTLRSSFGAIFKYDVLIIATGCTVTLHQIGTFSTRLSDWGIKAAEPKNVLYMRDIRDIDKIRDVVKAKKGGKAMIAGSSYVGLELAAALKMNNFDEVSLHFPEPWFLPQFFEPSIAAFYDGYFGDKGVEFLRGTVITDFSSHENGEVKTVTLTNGRVMDVDIVIVIFSNLPSATLFYGQVVIEKGGIKTDGNLRTSVPDVYAIGDVATFPSKLDNDFRRVEQADHARKSAEHAVKAIKASEHGKTIEPYDYLPYLYCRPFDLSWEFYGDNVGEAVIFGDTYSESSRPTFGTYWVKDGKIVGAFLEGGTPEENQAIANVARIQPYVADMMDWLEIEVLDFAFSV